MSQPDYSLEKVARLVIVPLVVVQGWVRAGRLPGRQGADGHGRVSRADLVAFVEKSTSVEEVNKALKSAAEGPLKGILGYTTEELVSSDYKGDDRSSIVDALLTRVVAGNCVKVIAWYDNEWGYSFRVRDLVNFVGKKGL